jgi:cysteine-rich repeat protein
MHRPNARLLLALLTLPSGCALERLEAKFEEHGVTYNTTDVPDSDPVADTSTGMEDTGSTTAASADGGEVGHGAEGDTGTASTSTTGDPGTTGEETTGGPQPVCGNGVLEKFGWMPEECDDGNLIPDDGCDDSCSADRVMFVSSKVYQGGDFKSLYLADALCAQAANDAGLANWLKFRAWLSDSKTSARDRFKFSTGRIVLVNGLVVADSWIDLLAGKLQHPPEVTEKGETYHGAVWTGTNPQGVGVPGSTHCLDWTSFSADDTAYRGYSDQITAEWTLSANWDNPFFCGGDFAVYCIEER